MNLLNLTTSSILCKLDVKLELFHHNTKSFAQHKAFDDIYEAFDWYKDDLIEKIIGYTGDSYSAVSVNVTYSDTTGVELVNDMYALAKNLAAFSEANGYMDLKNIADSLSGLGAKLNYLLTLNESAVAYMIPRSAYANPWLTHKIETAPYLQGFEFGNAFNTKVVNAKVDNECCAVYVNESGHVLTNAIPVPTYINESGEISNDKEFKEYATLVLRQAHGDSFDSEVADKMVDDLLDKYKDNYGAMVGALTSGFGNESLNESMAWMIDAKYHVKPMHLRENTDYTWYMGAEPLVCTYLGFTKDNAYEFRLNNSKHKLSSQNVMKYIFKIDYYNEHKH
jgi:hypothetical protein